MNQKAEQRPNDPQAMTSVGRYLLQQPIARGGMATVHAARLVAAEGVTRLVAVKRLHPQFVDDPDFVTMFHDEARIASRIHHPNVVPVLDVVREGGEVILVQEYVHGVPLSFLLKRAISEREPIPISIAMTIVSGILAGLHAAHEALDETGEPLGIVHRDVSPQNVLVSVDGVPRLVDFGIAKAKTSEHHTREGFFKGKLSYMPPEQLRGETVTRAADVYAAGVLLWELVVTRRFHEGKTDPEFVRSVASGTTLTPTEALEPERELVSADRWAAVYRLEPVILRAMALAPEERYATAAEMAEVLAEIAPLAPASEVASWVRFVGAEFLERRQQLLVSPEDSYRPGRVVDSMRPDGSSGTRIRIDVAANDVQRSASLDPGPVITMATNTGSWTERPMFSVRSLAPWALSAVLLVVIGVLAGLALRRDPAEASRAPAFQRVEVLPTDPELAAPTATASSTFETDDTAAAQMPTATRSASSTASSVHAAARPSVAAPPSAPAAPARFFPVAAPRVTAAPSTAPSALPPAKDCNPPFYFDGNKKVFKPACI